MEHYLALSTIHEEEPVKDKLLWSGDETASSSLKSSSPSVERERNMGSTEGPEGWFENCDGVLAPAEDVEKRASTISSDCDSESLVYNVNDIDMHIEGDDLITPPEPVRFTDVKSSHGRSASDDIKRCQLSPIMEASSVCECDFSEVISKSKENEDVTGNIIQVSSGVETHPLCNNVYENLPLVSDNDDNSHGNHHNETRMDGVVETGLTNGYSGNHSDHSSVSENQGVCDTGKSSHDGSSSQKLSNGDIQKVIGNGSGDSSVISLNSCHNSDNGDLDDKDTSNGVISEKGVSMLTSPSSRVWQSYGNVSENIYEEIQDDDCNTAGEYDYNCSFEPAWAGSVGKKGDVFYVESGTTDWSSEPPPGGTDDNYQTLPGQHPPPGGTQTHHNGLNNAPHPHQGETVVGMSKTKKGLRNKVKRIITPKSKQNNNNDSSPQQHNGNSSTTTRNNFRNHLNHSPHTVTFNDVPTGLTKDVRLFVDPHRHNYGRRATLCETLFGIVPGYFGSKASQVNGLAQDRRIMVQGLLPDGEALRTGQIKIGDWLMCVNDLEVNFDNFDSLLSAITSPMELKLTLQKLAVQAVSTPRPGVVRKSPVVNDALVRLVSGDRANLQTPSLANTPHCVLFLTPTQSDAGPKDDLIYQFPQEGSKLVNIRGLFLTLSNLVPDITDNAPRSSCMVIENKLVHVAYVREGHQMLVIALPADRLMLVQVLQLVDDIVRLLRVLYGSLKSAFGSKENTGRLDHFFTLLCQRALLRQEMVQEGLETTDQNEPLLELLPGVRTLHLPEETKVIVNDVLCDFEAADFADMSEDFYDMRRAYTVLGCTLFYKGYLLASHLHHEDLQDAALYLRYYCLLTLCHFEQMGQVVVWKEVFPWRRCHVQTDPLLPGYTEPEARWFLLIVGMKNIMLAVLLEAGGCATWAEGHPTPDPFYVDQAKASLLQLENLDVPTQCELRLMSPSIPSLASVDWFFPPSKGGKEDPATATTPLVKVHSSPNTVITPSRKLLQPESILKKRGGRTPSPQSDRLRPPGGTRGPGALYDVESDADSHSTGNSDSSTPIMDRRGRKPSDGSDQSGGSSGSSSLFKGQKKKRTLLSAHDVTGLRSSLRQMSMEEGSFVKLTSGCDNTLFHYVHLDCAAGVFICPTQQELLTVTSPTHSHLLTNFHNACLTIRAVFQDTSKKQHLVLTGTGGQFGSGAGLGSVREHGILFQCSPENWTDTKRAPPVISYWVIGRQLQAPYQRELFVCFQDSAQQNLIELAFRLGFGILT